MPVMQRMRDNTHIILWMLLILFVLSLTIGGLVGGADILDIFSSKKKLQGKAGAVDGKEFDAMHYSRLIQSELDRLRDEGQDINDDAVQRISDQIWESYVSEILVGKEIKRLGLEATNWEIYEYLMEYPPDFLTNQEAFQTDGKFDRNKYIQALTRPQGDEWIGVEQYLKGSLPFQKIHNLIDYLPIITDGEVYGEYLKTKVPYTLETLFFPFSIVSSDSIAIPPADVTNYYNEHKKEYFVPETREMEYIYFDLKPSASDTLAQYDLALSLKKRIENGESFETVAAEYTEDPSGKNNGGDLGWFDRQAMVEPFNKAAFALRKGHVSEPVLTQFGYHLILVEDKRTQNNEAQVKARHILLKIKPGPETLEAIRSKSSLFAFDANDFGFEAAADSNQLKIKNTGRLFQNSKYITGLGAFPRAIKFAFGNQPVGSISELLNSEDGYAIFKLSKINPESYITLQEVKGSIQSILLNEKRTEKLHAIAQIIRNEIDESQSLKLIAGKNPNTPYELHEQVFLNTPLKGLSRSDAIIGTILALKKDQVSPPVRIGNQYLIIKLMDVGEIDPSDYRVEKESIRDRLMRRAKSSFYNSWVTELKENATIIDNRSNLY
jgi:peptidyl-prolyl cis-trans isomerase D